MDAEFDENRKNAVKNYKTSRRKQNNRNFLEDNS